MGRSRVLADLDNPTDRALQQALGGSVEPQVAEMIGERAGGFCDMVRRRHDLRKILVRVTNLAASDTALQRLSVITVASAGQ
jgi:hypothetical protein